MKYIPLKLTKAYQIEKLSSLKKERDGNTSVTLHHLIINTNFDENCKARVPSNSIIKDPHLNITPSKRQFLCFLPAHWRIFQSSVPILTCVFVMFFLHFFSTAFYTPEFEIFVPSVLFSVSLTLLIHIPTVCPCASFWMSLRFESDYRGNPPCLSWFM